ncbi:hypothetical protein CIPAW_07G145400 [Carya illinoinensis]|uniref:Uncharacterized protein n=1 Tax=Carya illinoinensis TaxID=32201 RepID=A0A8T1PW33_CARIL|nr:hypothetical protein CIPAW_07G145400 [Carya illinoinensis]KAG6648406.1 hypothetical protein CIPAW_07G145400 [Carya illinoinensis]
MRDYEEKWVDWEDQILEDTFPLVGFVRMILHSWKGTSRRLPLSRVDDVLVSFLDCLKPKIPHGISLLGNAYLFDSIKFYCTL